MSTSALEAQDGHVADVRRKGSAVEITDDYGRHSTLQLDELNEADRALAEKFGYKPVGFAVLN